MTALTFLLISFENGDREHKDRLLEIADGNLCFFNDEVSVFPETHLTSKFESLTEYDLSREGLIFLLELSTYYDSLMSELILDVLDFMDVRLPKYANSATGIFDSDFILEYGDKFVEDILIAELGLSWDRISDQLMPPGMVGLEDYFVEDQETTSWIAWKLWERNDREAVLKVIDSDKEAPCIMMKPIPEPREFGPWSGGTWSSLPLGQQSAFAENLLAVNEEKIFSGHRDLVSLLAMIYLHPGTESNLRRRIGDAMAPLLDDFPIVPE